MGSAQEEIWTRRIRELEDRLRGYTNQKTKRNKDEIEWREPQRPLHAPSYMWWEYQEEKSRKNIGKNKGWKLPKFIEEQCTNPAISNNWISSRTTAKRSIIRCNTTNAASQGLWKILKAARAHSVVSDSFQAPLVHGILQAMILECAAISSSRGSYPLRDGTCTSCIAGGFLGIPKRRS